MHGPCGDHGFKSPCMKDKKYSKNYPKTFCEETTAEEGRLPRYRKPNDGRAIAKNGVAMDNTWIVPHNVDLLIKYNAHINVEICNTAKSIKYLYKYVYKGHDRADVAYTRTSNENNQTENGNGDSQIVDEIKDHLDSCYVSASEAIWRILQLPLHQEFPAHQRLHVHLPGQTAVFLNENNGETLNEAVDCANTQATTLMAWFDYNRFHPEARRYKYV